MDIYSNRQHGFGLVLFERTTERFEGSIRLVSEDKYLVWVEYLNKRDASKIEQRVCKSFEEAMYFFQKLYHDSIPF